MVTKQTDGSKQKMYFVKIFKRTASVSEKYFFENVKHVENVKLVENVKSVKHVKECGLLPFGLGQ